MAIMDSVFPETNKPSDNKANSKSQLLLGNENELLANYGAIPKNLTETDVIDLAKKNRRFRRQYRTNEALE